MLGKCIFAAMLAASGALSPARAEDYPTRPITMIIPLAVGGSTDVLGRIMAKGMSQALGQTVIVENTSGAAGVIGVTRGARSAPDGYTIQWGMWGTNVANGAIYNLDFDLLNDLEPVALVATQPFLIDARKTMPANNLKELIAWLKQNGDKTTMGNSGVGSPSHVAGVLMQNTLGMKWQMVSYRSAGLATQDLLAGTIDILLDTPAVSLPHVKSGDLKSLRSHGKERVCRSRRIFRPPTKPACPVTISISGTRCGRRRARRNRSSPSSTPRCRTTLADPETRQRLTDLAQVIYPPRNADARSACTLSKRPRSRNGTRSSRPPASSRNNARGVIAAACQPARVAGC